VISVEGLREGGRTYFEEVVREYSALVLTIVRAHGRDREHTEDLFQETWTLAYEKRTSFRGRGSFKAWLHRLATNVCLSDHRARRIRSRFADELARQAAGEEMVWMPEDPVEESERGEQHRELHRALAQLSKRQMEAISLRILEDKSVEEVAATMGVRESTVRSNIRHGLRRLREIMEIGEDELS
jgi:RNA polymerase sigma-70 factor (ECF subfamily)